MKKNQYIQFLMHGHSSSPTFGLHLERSSKTLEKGHLPWSDFMVHGVNRPLGGWVIIKQVATTKGNLWPRSRASRNFRRTRGRRQAERVGSSGAATPGIQVTRGGHGGHACSPSSIMTPHHRPTTHRTTAASEATGFGLQQLSSPRIWHQIQLRKGFLIAFSKWAREGLGRGKP